MTLKLVLLFAFMAAAKASFIPINQIYPRAPVALPAEVEAVIHEADEYDPHPQYKFSYDVEDKFTGDFKSQNEERYGDVVHGEYSLIDADGYKRTVKYTADDHNGFNAVVERIPLEKNNVYLPSFDAAETEHFEYPIVQKSVAPLGYFSATIDPVRHVTKSVAPESQYASRYTSYDAPIYLPSALLASKQH